MHLVVGSAYKPWVHFGILVQDRLDVLVEVAIVVDVTVGLRPLHRRSLVSLPPGSLWPHIPGLHVVLDLQFIVFEELAYLVLGVEELASVEILLVL